MRLGADMWATPPGGLPQGARATNLKGWIAYFVVVSLLLAGGVTYASMRTSTAVSTADALAEFQATRSDSSPSEVSEPSNPDHRARSKKTGGGGGAEPDRKTVAASAEGPENESTQRDDAPPSRPGSDPKQGQATQISRPQEGVYAWTIDGYEQAPGVRRDLPERSHRVITYTGDLSWQEHLIFSEEREQWLNLAISTEGVTTTSVRNRVKMGPVEEDKTVTYNPPVFVARFPSRVGHSWSGSWSGKTSGSYTAKVFERTTLTIEGEAVDVYATEVVMEMTGEISGRATTRSWYSPEHRLVVRQGQDMRIDSGPTTYRSEWIGQVLSLDPQT